MTIATDQRFIRIEANRCIYCGDRPQSLDHFPPRAVQMTGWLLPACNDCNSRAGAAWPFDFAKRAEYVKNSIIRKNKKLLASPVWGREELAVLGRNLKTTVNGNQNRRRMVHARVAWDAIAYLGSLKWQVTEIEKMLRCRKQTTTDHDTPPVDLGRVTEAA